MICRTCRDEVRFGRRRDTPGWWHQEDVEHDVFPVPAPEVVEIEELPPVEVWCHPVETKDELVPGGCRTITNLLAKQGWELCRLTHARGPYVGAKDKVLSISDTIVLGARGSEPLDGAIPIAVSSWRDGKFDFAYRGFLRDGRITDTLPVNATELKNWIKGAPET